MKKRWTAAVAAALVACCFVGCMTACEPNDGDEPAKLYAPYYEEDLETITFTDMGSALVLNMSANTHLKTLLLQTEYYEYAYDESQMETGREKYRLSLQEIELEIYEGGVVRFVYGEADATAAVVKNNEFAYLDTMLVGGEAAFGGYTAEQTLTVKNAEDAEATVLDKEDFLTSLNDVLFVKLKDKAHYQTGEKKYTVTIGEDTIIFYDNFADKNGELYVLSQGDYGFLSSLQFDTSSGWLPWL